MGVLILNDLEKLGAGFNLLLVSVLLLLIFCVQLKGHSGLGLGLDFRVDT